MTGAETYTYILQTLKRTDKSTEVYNAITDTVMDMRLRMLSESFKTISTALTISTIGNYSAALPSDFGHLIGDVMIKETAADLDYGSLEKISIEKYNELYASRFNTAVGNRLNGTPIHYCIFGGNLLVGNPVDKTTYEFRFAYTQEAATAITSGTTSVPFTDRYRKVLRYGVLKEVYVGLELYDEANIWSTLYEADLQKIVENDRLNTKDNSPMAYNGI